jgi:hypothetical protein
VNELGENKTGKVPSPCGGQISNLGYYMKESMDNYFRSGLKKVNLASKYLFLVLIKNILQPLSAVPGCSGCHTPVVDEVASLAGAGYVR